MNFECNQERLQFTHFDQKYREMNQLHFFLNRVLNENQFRPILFGIVFGFCWFPTNFFISMRSGTISFCLTTLHQWKSICCFITIQSHNMGWNELDGANDCYIFQYDIGTFVNLFYFSFSSSRSVIYYISLNFNHVDFVGQKINGMNVKLHMGVVSSKWLMLFIKSRRTKPKKNSQLKMRRAIVTAWVVIVTTGE